MGEGLWIKPSASEVFAMKKCIQRFILLYGILFSSQFVLCQESWQKSVLELAEGCLVYITFEGRFGDGLRDIDRGSGLVVSESGHVLSCNHILPSDFSKYGEIIIRGHVKSKFEQAYDLQIVDRDVQNDLILLCLPNLDGRSWDYIGKFGGTGRTSQIYTLGYLWDSELDLVGLPGTITGFAKSGWLLSDAPTNNGMSGGPVFNQSGELVAINKAGFTETQKLSVFIPIESARSILDRVPNRIRPQVIVPPRAIPVDPVYEVPERISVLVGVIGSADYDIRLKATNGLAFDESFESQDVVEGVLKLLDESQNTRLSTNGLCNAFTILNRRRRSPWLGTQLVRAVDIANRYRNNLKTVAEKHAFGEFEQAIEEQRRILLHLRSSAQKLD